MKTDPIKELQDYATKLWDEPTIYDPGEVINKLLTMIGKIPPQSPSTQKEEEGLRIKFEKVLKERDRAIDDGNTLAEMLSEAYSRPKCTKPHCDCALIEEKIKGHPVKSYPCLAPQPDLSEVKKKVEAVRQSPEPVDTEAVDADYTNETLSTFLEKSKKTQPEVDLQMVKEAMDYWQKRCEAAEKYIDCINSNCDMNDEVNAQEHWQSLKEQSLTLNGGNEIK